MHDSTPVHGGIGLQKDSELREFMNHHMLKMTEGGILRRIDTTYGIKVVENFFSFVQGDTSGCSQGFVDIMYKSTSCVLVKVNVLKPNFCLEVN